MRCRKCKREITEDQLRGNAGMRCAHCYPQGPKPIKAAAKPKKTKKTTQKVEPSYPTTITALNTMKKKELVTLAEELGSSTKGLKDELVKRLAKKLKIK